MGITALRNERIDQSLTLVNTAHESLLLAYELLSELRGLGTDAEQKAVTASLGDLLLIENEVGRAAVMLSEMFDYYDDCPDCK